MKPSYKYISASEKPDGLYEAATKCLELVFDHLDSRPISLFPERSTSDAYLQEHRIRVNFSTSVLAYFFKLLHKAGALDSGPVTQLLVVVSKNFVTPGMGDGYISVSGLTTRYKQVVQGTADSLRILLFKMLKLLDDEFF